MGANTKYKDSVFSFLFSNPDTLRELYGALEGVTLPPDVPVTINTLSDVLFLDRINDISFAIGDKQILKLSDAFEQDPPPGLSMKEPPTLELVVRVININQGRNSAIVRRCAALNGYSAFVAKVREFEKETKDRKEAMKKAVRYCREHDILKDFLEQNASEHSTRFRKEPKFQEGDEYVND